MNEFDYENEIIEVDSDNAKKEDANIEILDAVKNEEKKPKKNKKSIKEKWDELTKKQKTIIIVSSVVVLLLIIGLIVYFVFFGKGKEEDKPKDEPVVVEKDNYRYEDGKLIFLDKSDKELGTYECKNKDSEKCLVAKNDYSSDKFERIISVDENDQEIEKTSQIYHDNYVFVQDGEDIVIYDIKKSESDLKLKTVKTYGTDNYAVVEDETNKFGLLEIKDTGYDYLIKPSYDNLGIINTELSYLIATDKDKNYIIDTSDKKLSSALSSNVMSVNKNYIVTSSGSSYSLYDYKNKELLSGYDYIGLHTNLISLVNSKKLYLRDNNLNKLYEEGIKLDSTDYVKKYVYDKDNKLVETKNAYEVTATGDEISITIGDNIQTINAIEGKVSSNLKYMNYFDGKIYFYRDEEKTDLLGTYTCTNKNNLTDKDPSLNKCHIYTEGENTSGIYNSNYVFIYDNYTTSESKVYLFELKNNKTKGTYSKIEFIDTKALSNEVKQMYTDTLLVKAQSAAGANKGNFGVIEITSEKAAGKVSFNYKSIELANNYYVLIDKDNYYSLYDNKFNSINERFNELKTFANYYVGIFNSKLNVYSYDSTKGNKGLLLSGIKFKKTWEFTDNANKGFTITIDGTKQDYDKDGVVIQENNPVTDPNVGPAQDSDSTDEG